MDKKLSAAQIKMLNNIANKATAAYPENTAKSLFKRGLINIPLYRYDGVGYTLTPTGKAALHALNPVSPFATQRASMQTAFHQARDFEGKHD